MKKITALFLSLWMVQSLSACSNENVQNESFDSAQQENTNEENNAQTPAEETNDQASADEPNSSEETDTNILIVYFSVMETDGVDTVGGASRVAIDGELYGNNQYVAQIIQRETGGDLFAIETVQEYPTTHDPLLDFAYEEKANNARPELASSIENLEDYDTIFLVSPNWNADLPMPLYTFLETYDFSGKTIIPATVHGGSSFSRNIQTIASLQPDATVITEGLSISRNNVSNAESDIVEWVNGLNLDA